ncbi:MAG TPA: carboxymuconolactone decarboxylase family protein [Vicinamibacteria bacterium]|nr:carboxymuconolactone decarboxylase family protein [Vicinamibacteria bacterium]
MNPRIDLTRHYGSPLGRAMLALQREVDHGGLDPVLQDLVKIRASQINGCAYCIDMHTKDARARGETEQRIYALDAWRETPFFNEKERAVLGYTEAVTRVWDGHVADDVWEETTRHLTEQEVLALTFAIVAINGWNRLAISLRSVPGTYQPRQG